MNASEIIAEIVKAEAAMRTAQWQIDMMHKDIAALRRCLLELAYMAEEYGIKLSDMTKHSQDTIVQARLGGFSYEQ